MLANIFAVMLLRVEKKRGHLENNKAVKVKVRRRRVIPRDFFGSFFSKKMKIKNTSFPSIECVLLKRLIQ